MPITCEIDKVAKKLQKASKSQNNEKALAEAFLDYLEAKENCNDAALYQFGLTPDKTLCETLANIQKNGIWEDAICAKANQYLNEAWKEGSKHKDRRKNIEDAIRLLKRLHEERGENLNQKTLILLAKAYLRRSKIIRPKGITTPEKKKEAIKEGIKYAEDAITKSKGNNYSACCLKALLYLELDRLGEEGAEILERLKEEGNGTIQEVLEKALPDNPDNFNPSNEDDIRIAVRYSELNNGKYLDKILSSSISGTELELARAYKIKADTNNLKKEMKKVIKKLYRSPFSTPIWDDTVKFIKEELFNKVDCWQELSLSVWKVCNAIEKRTSSLHIRWYWSRQRNLYDLAFIAAGDNYKLKARIADSVKSLPALKWNAIEEYEKGLPEGNEKKLMKEVIEANESVLGGGYIKKMPKETSLLKTKQIPMDKVPDGWIVIHFYLNHLEGKGYALIYNADLKKWEEKDFQYGEIFKAYMEWQTNYTRYKEGAAGSLVKLCKTIGDKMDFLFNLPKPENDKPKPVIFPRFHGHIVKLGCHSIQLKGYRGTVSYC